MTSNSHSLTFVGTGDAFGSGGRAHTCFCVDWPGGRFLIDCGAASLPALKALGIRTDSIDHIVISHLHGDHFGGLPFFLLESKWVSRRSRPLHIVGPPGLENRCLKALEIFYAGSDIADLGFEVHFSEILEAEEHHLDDSGDLSVLALEVDHPSGAPTYALRIRAGERTISYSGDTAWTERLYEIAKGSDLFICECYAYDEAIPYHISYVELVEKEFDTKRLMITHLGERVLRQDSLALEVARDGQVVDL